MQTPTSCRSGDGQSVPSWRRLADLHSGSYQPLVTALAIQRGAFDTVVTLSASLCWLAVKCVHTDLRVRVNDVIEDGEVGDGRRRLHASLAFTRNLLLIKSNEHNLAHLAGLSMASVDG